MTAQVEWGLRTDFIAVCRKSSSVGRASAAQDLRGLLMIRPCYVLGLVSLGGDRASLAARPDGLRLRAWKKS